MCFRGRGDQLVQFANGPDFFEREGLDGEETAYDENGECMEVVREESGSHQPCSWMVVRVLRRLDSAHKCVCDYASRKQKGSSNNIHASPGEA